MRPLHDTRSTPDVLLDVGRTVGKAAESAVAEVRRNAEGAGRRNADGEKYRPPDDARTAQRRRNMPSRSLMAMPNQYGFHFLPYPSIAFLDGSLAHLPLLQELPDPMSSAMWSSWVEINMQTAEKTGHPARRSRRDYIESGIDSGAGVSFAGHCAGRDCDAGRSRTRELHAICERARRKSDRAFLRR